LRPKIPLWIGFFESGPNCPGATDQPKDSYIGEATPNIMYVALFSLIRQYGSTQVLSMRILGEVRPV
jgi:hypothetical protein